MEEKSLQEEMDRLSQDLRLAHATGEFDGETANELLQRMDELQRQLREAVIRIMRDRPEPDGNESDENGET